MSASLAGVVTVTYCEKRVRPAVVEPHPHREPGSGVVLVEDLAAAVQRGDDVAPLVGDRQLHRAIVQPQRVGDRAQHVGEAFPRHRRADDRIRVQPVQACGSASVEIALVEGEDLGHRVRPDLGEHRSHRADLAVGVRHRRVDDVNEQV